MGDHQTRDTFAMSPLRKHRLARTWISAPTIVDMLSEASRVLPSETGGVLLGYWTSSRREVVVTRVIGPGPMAVHTPLGFTPDGQWQQRMVARAYRRSNRIETYLGDWHTHPSGSLKPSRLDTKTAKAIADTRAARVRQPLLIIVVVGDDILIRAYLYRKILTPVPITVFQPIRRPIP